MPPKKGGTSGSSTTGTAPKPADFMPNISDKWDFLPGVKRWNGIPFHDFTTFWFAALIVALGSIVQSGNCRNNLICACLCLFSSLFVSV